MSTGTVNGSKLINRTHPEYATHKSVWDFLQSSYEGGMKYISNNLFQYIKEGNVEFDKRKERAYRENHTRRIVDLIISYLFKAQPTRVMTNQLLIDFYDNVDGLGTPMHQKLKYFSSMASVLGRVYIVMDKRQLPEEERTGTQRDNLKEKPYVYMVFPQNVLDISFDENGAIRWLLIKESIRDDEDPFESSGDVTSQYRLWTREGCFVFDEGGEYVAEKSTPQTNLGVVPVIPLDGEEYSEFCGASTVADVAYLDRAIFNNWSRLDVIVNDQTFSQLIFPVEALPMDSILDDEKLQEQFLTLSTKRIITYSGQAGMAPSYIAPDAGQAQFILDMVQAQIKQLYASMGLAGEVVSESKAASGVSRSYDFDKLNKMLVTKATALEKAENLIVSLFSKWSGITIDDFKVDYPDDFDVKSLSDEILIAQELTLLGVSERFNKEIMKRVAKKALPKIPPEILTEINEEIEETDYTEEIASKASGASSNGSQSGEDNNAHGANKTRAEEKMVSDNTKTEAQRIKYRIKERIEDKGKRAEQKKKRQDS
ncbi:MAG: hypothetical protein EOL88_01535 [Bacteroidia bacterium]|nr:hypothetical protein [Bacteroidia bacterium]